MKKFFTQKINIVHAVIVILTLVVGVSSVAAVSPGGNITPIIHRGGGNQVMDYLRIGTGNLLGNLSVRDNKTLAHFTGDITDPSAVFRVGDNALVRNQLFVGNNVSASQNNIWNTSYITTNGTIGAALQAVNVLGTARATNLDSLHQPITDNHNLNIPIMNQSGSDKVCIDRQGGLRLCPDTPPVQINGQCGAAQGATLSGVPAANLLCVNGLPSNYTFQSDGTTAWTCFGENDGTDASCTANQPMGVCGTAGSETFAVYPDDGDACPFFGGNDGQLLIHSLSPLVGICMPENHPESLCAEGDASDVTFDSDLSIASWTCSNGGATEVSCNSDRVTIEPEPEPVSPQCAEFPGIHESQPADETNGCDSGEYTNIGDTDTHWQWGCGSSTGFNTCQADKPLICLPPVITSDNLTIIPDPERQPGSTPVPNAVFIVDFDDTVYENVELVASLATSSFGSRSSAVDTSPVSDRHFGDQIWILRLDAMCISTGEEVTSNPIQAQGSMLPAQTTAPSCTNPVWVDGSSFEWGGMAYNYFTQSQSTVNPGTTAACGGYVVNNQIWYKYECIGTGATNGPASGNYWKYTLNDVDLIYTNSSGTPLNQPENIPDYPTMGSPNSWIPNSTTPGIEYSRLVPVANAC